MSTAERQRLTQLASVGAEVMRGVMRFVQVRVCRAEDVCVLQVSVLAVFCSSPSLDG